MNDFQALVQVIDRLLAPDGCPWDREQTLQSMRSSLVEETYEVIEAINDQNDPHLEEELGDLLFNVLFLCKLGEKEQRLTLLGVIQQITAKLIRRHPHIFGEAKVTNSEEVLKQWDNIKKEEKKHALHQSELDRIPKDLPVLVRAQKLAKRFKKEQFHSQNEKKFSTAEDQAGDSLWNLIEQMMQQGIYPEEALRKRLGQLEQEYRSWEKQK